MPVRALNRPSLSVRVGVPAILLLCLAALAGCGVDSERYIAKNEALLERLPTLPEAGPTRVSSTAYKRWDDAVFSPIAPVRGFQTYRSVSLTRPASARKVLTFYRDELGGRWQRVAASPSSLSLRNGDAYLHVLAGDDRVTLWVDHDYCKSDWKRPSC